jgi:putative ABC transport system substrate-binding protein
MPRIGWLGGPTRASAEIFIGAFQEGLKERGWVEGRTLAVEWRFADGQAERLPGLASELVVRQVDAIVVPSTPTALAAKHATATIPIVTVAVGDPVALGLVASLARPGGNVTGLTAMADARIMGKVVSLLREAVPTANRLGLLWNPATAGGARAVREAAGAAKALGASMQPVEARNAAELDDALAAMASRRIEALVVAGDILFLTHRARMTEWALRQRMPVIYTGREYAEEGGLMSYAPALRDLFRRAGSYVDRILKGAKPGDLPMEQPTTFELVLNLKTARALRLTLPPALVARADDVIR